MAIEYPIYLLILGSKNDDVDLKVVNQLIREWMPLPEGAGYEEYAQYAECMWGTNGPCQVMVPHDVGQDRAIELGDLIRRRYPDLAVSMQNSFVEMMEPGEFDRLLAGERPPVRKRGDLN